MSPLPRLRRHVPVAVAAAACLAAAPAAAAVTRDTPVGGAAVAAPPTFTWTLGADEVPNALLVSDISRVDGGRLGSPFVDRSFGSAASTFTYRGHGLDYAGIYYWQLVGFNQATSDFVYPRPARFTVPGRVTLSPLKTFDARWSHDPYETGFRARTTCNFMNPVRTRLTITKGAKVVFDQRMADQTCGDAAHSQKLDIRYPGHETAKGAHLEATVTLSKGRLAASRSVRFVAY